MLLLQKLFYLKQYGLEKLMTFSPRIFALTLVLGLALILVACASESPAVVPPTDAPVPTSEPAAPAEAPAATEAVEAAPAESTDPTAEPAAPEVVAGGVSFQNDVLPILERSCVRCHGGMRREEGLDLRAYAGLMAGSVNGPVVIAGNADGSQFITLVMDGEMPRRAPRLADEQVQILIDWVNQGALDN